jgi:glutathione synthase/RimK-type ligase-like ATP-grasp enzyme
MTKKIAVLWDSELDMERKKPFAKEKWNIDYEEFSREANKHDMELFLAHFSEYTDGMLEESYVYRGGEWEKARDVELDGVFDKYRFDDETRELKYRIAEQLPVLNHPELEELCKDKLATYQRFPEHVPETRKATQENVSELIERDGKAVVKPRYDFGGKGIQMLDSLEEFEEVDPDDHIVQEFVDASKGVPGTDYEGIHDVRSIVVSGDLTSGFIRMPEEGLISNVMQGGSMEVFPVEKYPGDARRAIQDVAEEIEEYEPSVYSVDLVFDSEGKPRVVELNSKPSLSFHDSEELKKDKMRVVKKMMKIFEEF